MAKNKKKFTFKLPKRSPLLYLIMILTPILLFFIIAIPVLYVKEYNANKVIVFEDEIANVTSDIVYGDKNTITDFNLVIYCDSYNDNSGAVSFKAFIYENENTAALKIKDGVSVRLGMFSDWIKTDLVTSAKTIKIKDLPINSIGKGATYNPTFTLSNVPNLPQKGNLPFINVKEIPMYAYVSYTVYINGSAKTKHFILKYEHNDYMIDRIVFNEGTENEVSIAPSIGGILD